MLPRFLRLLGGSTEDRQDEDDKEAAAVSEKGGRNSSGRKGGGGVTCALCGSRTAPRTAFEIIALCDECYKLWQDFKLPDLTITREENNE